VTDNNGHRTNKRWRIPKRYSLTFICPVTIVVSYSGLSFFDCPFGLRYSPSFICSVAIVVSYSGLSFFDCPFGLRYPKGQSKKDNPE
jgi:CHASE3 domain sensor protein